MDYSWRKVLIIIISRSSDGLRERPFISRSDSEILMSLCKPWPKPSAILHAYPAVVLTILPITPSLSDNTSRHQPYVDWRVYLDDLDNPIEVPSCPLQLRVTQVTAGPWSPGWSISIAVDVGAGQVMSSRRVVGAPERGVVGLMIKLRLLKSR